MAKKHSRAQIVVTIGPATKNKNLLIKMIKHQMDVARLNFSHGTYKEHANYIKTIREAAKIAKRKIPIIQDLSGPRIQEKIGHHIAKYVKEIITPKDLRDLKFGLEQNIDYIAMSYIGKAADVIKLRKFMAGNVKPIIAKIERRLALANLDEIIKVSDAVMIARGDLGNEVPLEEIPFIEKTIINKCKKAAKPVITATQMMTSMINDPIPTRADVTDVAYAIINGSDAVMLSEETAVGKYPLEVIEMMERILIAAEKHLGKVKINFL